MATQLVITRFDPERASPPGQEYEAPSATLLNLIEGACTRESVALDVGCGAGRLTFAVAPWVQEIVGVDISADAIARAESAADLSRLPNVRFTLADAEQVEYRSLVRAGRVDVVAANLYMTDAVLKRTRSGLRRRGAVVFSVLEAAQWQETGRSSRLSYTEPALRASLARLGLTPDYVGVEREILEFASPGEMREAYLAGSRLEQRWRADGRWEGVERYLSSGGRTLTVKSILIARARKG